MPPKVLFYLGPSNSKLQSLYDWVLKSYAFNFFGCKHHFKKTIPNLVCSWKNHSLKPWIAMLWRYDLWSICVISNTFQSIMPTTINHTLLTQWRHQNVDGVMGKCGKMRFYIKAYNKGSNKVFTSWIVSIWLSPTTSWDFLVKGFDGNVKFEGKIWCNFSLPCISLLLNKVKKVPI